ncbi:hypothetical protein DCC81_10240 [Chitinophaga parva]|uniref:DUF4349 domain-containing protein n=1 Tax=Chitinophaga parva TaxID=2169414 RepID=A0A2T7BEL8_9BACT|nr:DUF4349 domain-containing protein [Chitinophaga parva]PUZ24718.1 hypothetical protein DCC81_10240 [Chitinophaga parva]
MTQASFKLRFWRLFRWLLYLFLLLFLLRLVYGYLSPGNIPDDFTQQDFFSGIGDLRSNYASEKVKQVTMNAPPPSMQQDQKYEKTATISSSTASFDKDEQDVRKKTVQFNAVIQYERSMGNKGNRQLHLLIGVVPEKFDSFYVAMQQYGHVQQISVVKVDKTNEYRQLNAKKISLEKTLASLNELKSNGSRNLSDLITLHDKILDIESQLQDLGVSLGNFNSENEFCTIRLSLYEGARKITGITFPQRLKVALQWTIRYYALLMTGLAAASILVFFMLLILDKLHVIQNTLKKIGE